jgi:hypothetical protein
MGQVRYVGVIHQIERNCDADAPTFEMDLLLVPVPVSVSSAPMFWPAAGPAK